MVTLQYSSFAALSEWPKVVTLMTGCSKTLAEQALRGQQFLDAAEEETPWLEDNLAS